MAAQNTNDQPQTPPFDPRIEAKLGVPIKNIIAVASGKGGVGKSTVSVNLAVSLARTGAQVGLLDADIYGPNIPIMMGVDEMPPVEEGKLIPAEAHGVRFMSMGFLLPPEQALIWARADAAQGDPGSCSATCAGESSTTWSSICPRAPVTHSCRWPRSRP